MFSWICQKSLNSLLKSFAKFECVLCVCHSEVLSGQDFGGIGILVRVEDGRHGGHALDPSTEVWVWVSVNSGPANMKSEE